MFETIAYAMGQSQQSEAGQTPNPLISLMPLVFIFAVFYFLLIRPQHKRQKEHDKMVSGLNKNDEVITTSGIYGTIVNVKEKTFIIRVDDNVKLEFSKSAIATVLRKSGGN